MLGRDKLSLERKVAVVRGGAGRGARGHPLPSPTASPSCSASARPGSRIAAEKVAVEQTANQIAIRIGNVLLFNSGAATVLDQFKPIGDRIAATLDKEDGYIKVIGHTDNKPIGSGNVRFPSNYQLSIERAKNVAALFTPALAKPDRLQTDGKGETAPVADNNTTEGRARNRRVEIVIPRTDTGPVTERTAANDKSCLITGFRDR